MSKNVLCEPLQRLQDVSSSLLFVLLLCAAASPLSFAFNIRTPGILKSGYFIHLKVFIFPITSRDFMASSILALANSTSSLGSSSQALSSCLVYSSSCFTICGSCRDKRALWYRVKRTCMVIIGFLSFLHKSSIWGHTGQIDAAVLNERTKCSKLAMITCSSPGQRII